MNFRRQIAITVVMATLCLSASAADIAILRNGFTIRHERHQVGNETTRLYLDANGSGYVDVPTMDIVGFEQDTTPQPAPQASAPQPQAAAATTVPAVNIADVVGPISQKQSIDPALITSVIRAESAFNPRAV